MKKLKNTMKRIATLSLAAVLLTSSFPVAALAAEIDGMEPAVVMDTQLPESSEEEYPSFEGSKSFDGVKITVTADEGAFPEGAMLSVDKVSKSQEKQAQEAVENERDEDQNVAVSYTFDIKVLDKDGNEIEPADQSMVKVSFTLDEVSDTNLETNIYHITEGEGSGLTAGASAVLDSVNLSAEKQEVETDGDTATAETDGFSLYTVEFTYNDLQYVLPGDSSVRLSEILDQVGLTGEVSAVEISDESLFSADRKNGEWTVTAHKAFSSDEWMKVTISGVVFEITVTDAQAVTYIDENGVEKTCIDYTVLNGNETTLSAGWYVVNSTINYTHKITGSGNIHIILADGGKMNIGTEADPISDKGLYCPDSLTIYGQTGGTGELNSYTKDSGKAIFSTTVTINGGKVKANGKNRSFGIYAIEFYYNGGQISASDNDYSGVYAREMTFNWINNTDFIESNKYEFTTITIAEGKTFTDESNKYYIAENASKIGSLKNTKLSASTTSAYGVTFDSKGGSSVDVQILTAGSKATKPSDPSRDGCNFGGWYEDEKLTKEYGFNNTVNKSFTLYAKWIPNDYETYFGTGNDGSSPEKAYIISSADGWDYFSDALQHNDLWGRFEGKYISLDSDITVAKMAGSNGHEFMGTFDGRGHTINANLSGTDHFIAPFSYVKSATIKRLNVTGTVSGKMHCAGLVGSADGTLTIQNCNVGATVSSSGTHCGGILGNGNGANVSIKDSLFSGSITGAGKARGIFYGWGDSGTSSIDNCLVTSTFENSENIDLYKKNGGTVNVTNCYKTVDIGEYGTFTDKNGNELKILLGSGWTTSGDNVVPIMSDNDLAAGYIEGIKPVIPDPGSNAILISSLVIKNGKGDVVDPSNYDISCTLNGSVVNEIRNPGRYKIVVTGKGDYTGVLPYNCHVLTFEKEKDGNIVKETLPNDDSVIVDSTTTEMKNNYYVVDYDVTVSTRISVKGTVNLILCKGATLNAAKGISVTQGNSLTIYCEDKNTGKLIASNTNNYYAGIGGDRSDDYGAEPVKSGTIVIHGGEISAKGAYCSAGIGAAFEGEAGNITIYGGKITANSYSSGFGIGGSGATVNLGWCRNDDFIDSAGYQGTVNFNKNFLIDGTAKVATTKNAGGNKIVPSNATVCKVDFDSNGGSGVDQQSLIKGQSAEEPPKPRKSGYSFGGWYTDNTLSMPYDFTSPVNSSFTLYAKWVPNAAISYIGEDGALISGFTDYIPLEADYQTLTAGTYYVGSDLTLRNRVELEGRVSIILGDSYTLTTPEGISVEPEDVLSIYGQKGGTGKLVATAYHGNSAIGGDHWKSSGEINIYGGTISASGTECAAAIGGSDLGTGSTGKICILGGKVSASYKSTSSDFLPAIGAGKNSSKATIVLGYTSPDDYISAAGYNGSVSVVSGKTLVTDDSTPMVISGTVDDNSKINGKKLTPKKYTVSFDTNGGTGSVTAQIVAEGLKASVPTVTLTRTGYTAGVWMNGDSAYEFDTPVTTDLNLKMSWIANTYSVKFDKNALDASGTMTDEIFTYDEAAKKLTKSNFTRPEYKFAGWNTKADGEGISYTDEQEVRNLSATNNEVVTLYAQWIVKTTISPVVSITGWTYGDTANAPEVTAASNPGSGAVTYEYFNDSSCTIKTTIAQSGAKSEGGVPKNAGTWYVKATVAETAQYQSGTGTAKFSISPKQVTITSLSISDKTYDGTTAATATGTATIDGKVDNDDVSVTAGSAAFSDANAGTGKTVTFSGYSLSGTAAGNYELSAQPASVTADITQKAVTVTAKAQTVEKGGTISSLVTQAELSGALDGHTLSAVTLSTGNAIDTVGVFSDAITPSAATIMSGTTDVTANYNITYTAGTLTVTNTLVYISGVGANAKTYDGTTDTTVFGTAVLKKVIDDSEVSGLTVNDITVAFADKKAGTNKTVIITAATLSDTTNYTLDLDTSNAKLGLTSDINTREVTVSGITAENKTYDGSTDATLVYTNVVFNNLVLGDNLIVGAGGTFADANVGTGKTVTISGFALSGADADNYVLSTTGRQTSTTADITKAAHDNKTVSGSAMYGKSGTVDLSALIVTGGTAEYVGKTDNDNILNGEPGVSEKTLMFAFADNADNVGKTASVTIKVTSGNYQDYTIGATLTVNAKEVPVLTVQDITKTYDGTAVANSAIKGTAEAGGASVAGTWAFKNGQALTDVLDSGEKTVVFTPDDANAYESVETTLTLTIKKADVKGEPGYTAITASGKTLADANLTVGTLVPSAGTIAWDDATDTAVTQGTAYGWTYTPAGSGNYNVKTGSITLWVKQSGGGGTGGGTGGDSGGGSGGAGGTTPSKPDDPTPDPTPGTETYTIPVTNETSVPVETKITDGNAVVSEITAKDIEKITGSASGEGKTADTITIDLSGAQQKVDSVELTKGTVEALTKDLADTSNDVETVTIRMTDATVELDASALKAIAEQTGGKTVKLSVDKGYEKSSLNKKQQEAIGDYKEAVIFEACLESDGTRIHDLNGGTAKVSVQYDLPEGLLPEFVQMLYLDPTGNVERLLTTYENGWATGILTHCSEYAIVYDESGTADDQGAVEMNRLYNPNSGEHFYTGNVEEKDHLIEVGWNYEGIAWYAPEKSDAPVYRLYNPNAGDHHYTMNKDERDYLIEVGWNDEGIGWYSEESKAVTVWRLYNPNALFAGAHHFTTNEGERDILVELGWIPEGISWYGKETENRPLSPPFHKKSGCC